MRYANRLSVVTVAIAAGAAVALLLFAAGSSDATIYAPEPSIPPDCYVVEEPTGSGPGAPSDLTAEWSPYIDVNGILIDAFDVLNWTDNADDETCFVVEMKPNEIGATYDVVAILSANANSHQFISGTGHRSYRVYAANADGRSAYSNEDTVNAFYTPPTPSPSPSPPSPSPSPSPSTVTPTPTPSTVTPTPTPAALPKTGGLPD